MFFRLSSPLCFQTHKFACTDKRPLSTLTNILTNGKPTSAMRNRSKRVSLLFALSTQIGFGTACSFASDSSGGVSAQRRHSVLIDTVSLDCVVSRGSVLQGLISSIAIDSTLNPAMIERGTGSLFVHKANGECKVFGRYGGGPEEFMAPSGVAVMVDGTFAVLDFGKQNISLVTGDGRFLSTVKLAYLGEPSSNEALTATSEGFILTVGVPVPSRTGEGKYAGIKERFIVANYGGDSIAAILPRKSYFGECSKPYVLDLGLSTRMSARYDHLVLTDGSVVGGCTHSDSIWLFHRNSGVLPSLLFVLSRERKRLSRGQRDLLLKDAFERFGRSSPLPSKNDIDVPEYLPLRSSIGQVGPQRFAILYVDSLTERPEEERKVEHNSLRAWYSIGVRDLADDSEFLISLPKINLYSSKLYAAQNTVFLRISLSDGEEALLRIRLFD